MKILVTGAAGFIGANLIYTLLENEPEADIVGIDNMNPYYDVTLKKYRLGLLDAVSGGRRWRFIKGDIADKGLVDRVFAEFMPEIVVNLAAQAGARYSIEEPDSYISSNIIGFHNILEACRHSIGKGKKGVAHLVYASSSSVYGSNGKVPYSEDDRTDSPLSLYAATKKSNELTAHAYSKLYDIPTTGLRFFTVYGPAGRPDMAYFSFTRKLVSGENVQLFNYGQSLRDFTYVDDIVEGVRIVMRNPPQREKGEDGLPVPPYRLYNIGCGNPVNLVDFLRILSEELRQAGLLPGDFDPDSHIEKVPMQPGDVPATFADTSALERDLHFRPHTDLRTGLSRFVRWYGDYYGLW